MDRVVSDSSLNRGRWSKEEHNVFLLGLSEIGKDWKSLQSRLPSRSVIQIRSHAQKYFKNRKNNSPKLFSSLPQEELFKKYFVFLNLLRNSQNPFLTFQILQNERRTVSESVQEANQDIRIE